MTRRLIRTSVHFILVMFVLLVILLCSRHQLLQTSIKNYLPHHHPRLYITDLTVKSCVNLLSACQLDPSKWNRLDKDLYLNTGWFMQAYVHTKSRFADELSTDDMVIIDIKISRKSPKVSGMASGSQQIWKSKGAGIWVLFSDKQHMHNAVTAVDVLFGADAVEARRGWEILDPPLYLDSSGEIPEARLTVRREYYEAEPKPVLTVRKDGKFKIMQVSDLHLSTGFGHCRDVYSSDDTDRNCEADPRTLNFVGRVLDDEKPDLVILSGDQINGETAPDAQTALFKYAHLFIERSIPYAAIFGNHDDQGSLNRASQITLLKTLPYSLSEAGPLSISGVGNYVVEIMARGTQHSAMTLYLLDTHSNSQDGSYDGYDWIKSDQLQWLDDTVASLKKPHIKYSHIHLDMAFIHIPLPEYGDNKNMQVGAWREPVTSPNFNSHFKDALVRNHIPVVSCGHDHANEYCSLARDKDNNNKLELWMCYAGGSGFGGYGGYGGYIRRVRLWEVDTNEARITTWKRVEHGDLDSLVDEQIVVDAGVVARPRGSE